MYRGWSLLVVLAACGRISFDSLTDARTPIDAPPVDEAQCTFTDVHELTDLSSSFEDSEPALSPDGQTLVFASRRDGQIRLYAATAQGNGWTTPAEISAFATPEETNGPAWNATGDRLYFSSYRAGPLHLYVSTFAKATGFAAPSLVPGLEGETESQSPSLRADELEMFYSSRVPPNHTGHATRSSLADPWVPQGDVSELGAGGFVGISGDGLAIYTEEGVVPSFRIRRATRASFSSPWSALMEVPSLNATNSSGDPQATFDGTQILFASDRTTLGDFNLYAATRVCP